MLSLKTFPCVYVIFFQQVITIFNRNTFSVLLIFEGVLLFLVTIVLRINICYSFW